MELKLLAPEVKTIINAAVEDILSGKIKSFECDILPPSIISDVLKELDIYLDTAEMETNGWEWDYWWKFEHNGKNFKISGSGFYGSLTLKEDEDE